MSLFWRSANHDTGMSDQLREARTGEDTARMNDYRVFDGHHDLNVVGESHYQEDLWHVVGAGCYPAQRVRVEVTAVLAAEADNPYDANAVSVWVDRRKVGYLSQQDAELYHAGLLDLQADCGRAVALPGVVAGGGIRDDGPGMLGVFLRHDPADFGLRRPHLVIPAQSGFRTALADALATDQADDSYDMAWLQDLPGDDVRAIPVLRQLLARERDLLSRHFMYAELEKILYRARNAFTSALAEYDQVCQQHDAEMDSLRPVFIAKWGKIPLLETYRQMTIRQQKAGNYPQALWWAERGIVIYGNDSARTEFVEDLQHRAAKCRLGC